MSDVGLVEADGSSALPNEPIGVEGNSLEVLKLLWER